MGSQRRVTPKKKIRRRARRKFGMQMPNSEKRLPAPSRGELRRAAERMPMGNATTSEIAMARAGELEAGPDAAADILDHRLAVADGLAEIALEDPPHPVRVLQRQRPIQAQVAAERSPSRPRPPTPPSSRRWDRRA
jgi:hypothetical protein